MKTPSIKHALACGVLTLAATQTHAVVEAGRISLDTTLLSSPWQGGLPRNFSLSIQYDLESPNSTGVLFYFASGSLTGIGMTADRGADVYLVQVGDAFSNASITSNPNQTYVYGLATDYVYGPSIPVGNDFYLGIRSGDYGETPDTFGWAHFALDLSGKVQLVNSAMSFGDGGIIVGTLQAVPEPSTWALMGIGLTGLAWRARSARRQTRV